MTCQKRLQIGKHPRPRRARGFPALGALVGVGEEPVGQRLVPFVGDIAGRAAVDLALRGAAFDRQAKRGGQNAGRLGGLAFRRGRDAARARGPSPRRQREDARPAPVAQPPVGHRHRGVDRDLRVGQVAQDAGHSVALIAPPSSRMFWPTMKPA